MKGKLIPKKARNVQTVTKIEIEGFRQARSNSKGPVAHIPSFLHFLSPHPCPLLSQPVHGERKACLLREFTKENPATLSTPNTHASFLGREGPLSYCSSMPLARTPSPRERPLPPLFTNPAR